MRKINRGQAEIIDAVVAEKNTGGLTAAIIEKDFHVTEALHALCTINDPCIDLVLCGGTSLSKAHAIIERMSEYIDLKQRFSSHDEMSKNAETNHLRRFKNRLIEKMTALGFEPIPAGNSTKNRHRSAMMAWKYHSIYQSSVSLKPHLSLEYIARAPLCPTHSIKIGFLTDRLAEQPGIQVPIECVAIEETLGEKVLAFLRRRSLPHSATVRRDWDETLVRHIYDIFCIVKQEPASIDSAKKYFSDLVRVEATENLKQHEFSQHPKKTLAAALVEIESDSHVRNAYDTRLLPLIYGTTKPNYPQAYQTFKQVSEDLLLTLDS